MDFEQHFTLIVAAFIMNLFLFCISSIGFNMAKQLLKEGSDDNALFLLSVFLFMASFGFQCFALAYWLKSFY